MNHIKILFLLFPILFVACSQTTPTIISPEPSSTPWETPPPALPTFTPALAAATPTSLPQPTATPRQPTATPSPTPRPAATSTPVPAPLVNSGLIALSARIDHNWDIYAIAPSTRERTRLTAHPAWDRDPAFSPDGQKLAFASQRDGFWNLYLRTPDGEITQLTDDAAYTGAPAWSPDGKRIAFASMRAGNLDIWTLELNGNRPIGEWVNWTADSPRADSNPVWSPDGTQIAFTSWRYHDADILVLDLATGETRQITSTPTDEQLLQWQTNGDLVYTLIDGEIQDIYSRSPDDAPDAPGTRLTHWSVADAAVHSPNSEHLAFLLRHTHGARLLLQRPGAKNDLPIRLTEQITVGGSLSWTAVEAAWQHAPGPPLVLYQEQTHPGDGSPYDLVRLHNVQVGNPWLSDRVDGSFVAMRQRIIDETGRDFLAQLSDAWRSLDADGKWSSYTSWHKTGRAIDTLMDYLSPDHRERWLEVVLEPGGGEIYFRLYLRCMAQDGSQGMPLETRPWDLTADARQALTGGRRKNMPNGYYVDLTDLMAQYGWLRIAAHDHPDFHWHTNFVATEYWHFQKIDGLLWYDALLEVFSPQDVYTFHNWFVHKARGMPPWLARAKGIPIPRKEQDLLDMIAR